MTSDDPRKHGDDDHPQTIKGEPDARGATLFRKHVVPPHHEPLREEASPIPAKTLLGDVEDAARAHATDAETIGDAVGSGPGRDVGSGSPPDRGELGGGDPPVVTDDAEPLGTYRPGESRD